MEKILNAIVYQQHTVKHEPKFVGCKHEEK